MSSKALMNDDSVDNSEVPTGADLSASLRREDESSAIEEETYDVVPNPNAENVDLSELRGVTSNEKNDALEYNSETDLENLAELVPDVKSRRSLGHNQDEEDNSKSNSKSARVLVNGDADDVEVVETDAPTNKNNSFRKIEKNKSQKNNAFVNEIGRTDSMQVQDNTDIHDQQKVPIKYPAAYQPQEEAHGAESTSYDEGFAGSDHALEGENEDPAKIPNEFMNMNMGSSGQSVSTATQTHEVKMPMYLPTFKPATGCTNASDFIVRCFVARLRAGITVVKHGRSRWCKSRLRILHIHQDGRSLSWKPAEGEPTSSKRPPKLDLSTCLEVRHAWSPDPQNPMYTGTPILRQKCEAANAHKSFALIFKQRTVDITAVTADQCKVLMEGFSALCFRLQVANLAGRGKQHARPFPEEDGVSTTASATLTNSSTPRNR